MKRKKGNNYAKVPLDYESVKNHLLSIPDPELKLMGLVGLVAGTRVGEIIQLRTKDILGDSIQVRKTKSKGGKVQYRSVPVPEWLKPVIIEITTWLRRGHGELAFQCKRKRGNDGNALTPGAAHARIKKIFEGVDVGSQQPTFHTLRKTVANHLYASSGNNYIIPQLHLGHKSVASTVHYLDSSRAMYEQETMRSL